MNIQPKTASVPTLSVILPLSDAESVLPALGDALHGYLDSLGRSYELVFVGHGRGERSATLLHQQHRLRPDVTRVLLGRGLASAAAASLAGLIACKGQRIVSLPAYPGLAPEIIGQVVDLLDVGHDFVAAKRSPAALSGWKAWLARAERGLHAPLGGVGISDPACGVFGFSRDLLEVVTTQPPGLQPELLPALAFRLARQPTEVELDLRKYFFPDRASRNGPLKSPSWWHRVEGAFTYLNLRYGSTPWLLRTFAVLATGLALMALGAAVLVTLFTLLTASQDTLWLLFGLLFTGFTLFGLGLFGVYLDRLPAQWHGDPGFITSQHLRPKFDKPSATN